MFNLRNSNEADIPALQRVERMAARRFLSVPSLAFLATAAVTDSRTHALSMAHQLAWLVEDKQGTVLGFCYACVLADSLWLAEISTLPQARGKGVGALLLRQARDAAYRLHLKGVMLTTYSTLPWNEPWYKKQGFITLNSISLAPEVRHKVEQEKLTALWVMPRSVMWASGRRIEI